MNMCSIAGTSASGRANFPYSVSKGGVVMMTKEMAVEWARYGIRVNAIQPCQFMTPGLQVRLDNPELGPGIRDKFLSGIPLDRTRRAVGDDRPGAVPRIGRLVNGDRGSAAR